MSLRPRQWPGLDVLRCVAVLLVIIRHFPNYAPPDTWLYHFLQVGSRIGWAGVDLFFALSGFLISNLLFEEHRAHGRVDLGRFLARRAFKIYPGFYFLIGLSLIGLLEPLPELAWRPVLGEIFFLQNYLDSFWFHTWSLAVEEHFYLLIAFLLVARGHAAGVQNWPWVVAAFAIISLALRTGTVYSRPLDGWPNLWQTHLRIDSLFVGSLAGYVVNFHNAACQRFVDRHKRIYFSVTVGCLALPFFWELEASRFVQSFGLSILAAGCSLLVLGTAMGAFEFIPWTRFNPALEKIGRCSYAIYLWHMPVFYRFVQGVQDFVPFPIGQFWTLVLYSSASIVFGIVMTKWIEEPALRLREKLFPADIDKKKRPGLIDPALTTLAARRRPFYSGTNPRVGFIDGN